MVVQARIWAASRARHSRCLATSCARKPCGPQRLWAVRASILREALRRRLHQDEGLSRFIFVVCVEKTSSLSAPLVRRLAGVASVTGIAVEPAELRR